MDIHDFNNNTGRNYPSPESSKISLLVTKTCYFHMTSFITQSLTKKIHKIDLNKFVYHTNIICGIYRNGKFNLQKIHTHKTIGKFRYHNLNKYIKPTTAQKKIISLK